MSNELKVTGGEWFSKREGFSTVYVFSRIGGGLVQEVAACGPTNDGQDQQEANAHLLTASKKLYEALIQARESLADSLATPGGWYAIGSNHARDVIAEIDEALAAARGEAQ